MSSRAGDSASFLASRDQIQADSHPSRLVTRVELTQMSCRSRMGGPRCTTGVGGRPLTSQVHPGLETLSYSTRRTVFPADLVDDAVVPPGTQVVVLTYGETERQQERVRQAARKKKTIRGSPMCARTWTYRLAAGVCPAGGIF